jgi:hypothetical protein
MATVYRNRIRAVNNKRIGWSINKSGLLVGYARVSKADDQDTATQVKALPTGSL